MDIPDNFQRILQSITQDLEPGTLIIMKLFETVTPEEEVLEDIMQMNL